MSSIEKFLRSLSGKTLFRLYISFSIFMGLLTFCLFEFLFFKACDLGIKAFYYIAAVISVLVVLRKVSKFGIKISKIVYKILQYIKKGISFLFDFSYPGFVILASFGMVFIIALSISCVPIFLLKVIQVINISNETALFISVAIGSIFGVYCPKLFRWILKKHSPLKDWGEHDYQKFQINLALYLVNGKNINVIVNLLYFVYLFLTAFCEIEYHTSLINEGVDNAILKAFLVFIAFSGMLRAYKDKDISSEKLAVKMFSIILSRYHLSNEIVEMKLVVVR